MEAATTFQLEVTPSAMVCGFGLTEKYMIATGKNCIVHSIKSQRSEEDPTNSDRHAELDVGYIHHAAFHSPSNLMLLAGDRSPNMRLWSVEYRVHIRDFVKHNANVRRVMFLNEAQYVSGCSNGNIMIWERDREKPTSILRGHKRSIALLEVKDEFLFSGSHDKTVRIWDIASGKCVRVLGGHSGHVSILAFTPDPSILWAGCSGNGKVNIWNWEKGTLLTERQTEAMTNQLYTSIDGNVVTAGLDGSVRTWTPDGTLIKTSPAHDAPIRGIINIGQFVLTIGTMDGRIKLWDWASKRWLVDLQHEQLGFIANLSTGHGKLAVSSWCGSQELHQIQVWDLSQIEEFALKYINDDH